MGRPAAAMVHRPKVMVRRRRVITGRAAFLDRRRAMTDISAKKGSDGQFMDEKKVAGRCEVKPFAIL
jgi:hypothetical protein